jgi:hypothetical protein
VGLETVGEEKAGVVVDEMRLGNLARSLRELKCMVHCPTRQTSHLIVDSIECE